MEEILDILYAYAQETQIDAYLNTWEHLRLTYDLEEDWEAFRSMLTAEQDRRLDQVLTQEKRIGQLEEKAVFRCGLSLGVGLGRL